jgi:gliding motility-associated-like protein
MKTYLFFIISLFSYFNAFAQIPVTGGPAPELEWLRYYGGSGEEGYSSYNNTIDWSSFATYRYTFTQICVTDDGGYLFGVNTTSQDGDLTNAPGLIPPTPNFEKQGWLVKLNPNSSIAWQKVLPYFIPHQINKTNDGNYIIVGHERDTIPTATSNNHKPAIYKISPTGNIIWQKTYSDGGAYMEFNYIQATSDGGYIIAITHIDDVATINCPVTILNKKVQDLKLYKIDGQGNIIWKQCYGMIGFGAISNMIKIMPNNDIILLAHVSKPNASVDLPTLYTGPVYTGNNENVSNINAWLVRLDPTGNIIWKKTIGGVRRPTYSVPPETNGMAIDITSDGIYLTGHSNADNLVFINAPTYPTNNAVSNRFRGFLMKIDFNGNIIWNKMMTGKKSGESERPGMFQSWVETTTEGGCVTVSAITFNNGDGDGSNDKSMMVCKWANNGDLEWKQFVGGTTQVASGNPNVPYYTQYARVLPVCIKPTLDNGYVVLARGTNDYGDLCGSYFNPSSYTINDVLVFKLRAASAEPIITGNLAPICAATTLTAEQPLPQPTPPATYLWSNNATTASITNIGAGTYTVTITYENRCTKSTSVTVQASSINIPASGIAYTPATCAATNGSATISASGGLAPYIYTCASGSISANTVSGLSFGTYTVSITDANGCIGSTTITIPQAASTLAATAITTPTGCTAATGTATITIQNGVAPYTYTIDGGASNTAVTNTVNLPSSGGAGGGFGVGTYAVFFTDINGCTASTTFTITQAANNLEATAAAIQIPCAGGTGSISVSVTNGIAPVMYSINGGVSSTNNVFSGLAAGTYIVVATDFTGCTNSAVSVLNTAPAALTANITTQNATCGLSNGSLRANISGGTAPYIVTWTGNGLNGSTTTATNTVLFSSSGGAGGGFSVGAYVVTITDINACTFIAPSANIIGNPPITATITTTPTKCYGEASGSIAISNIQNAVLPLLYSIDNQPLSATNPIVNIKGGTHTIKIEDATGCKSETTTIVAEGPRFTIAVGRDTLLTIGDSLYIEGNITSGFPVSPTQYVWTCSPEVRLKLKGISGAMAHVEPSSGGSGEASCVLVATDARGCTATDALTIRLKDASSIFIPNAFTPNGDGYNEEFVIFGGALVERVELLRIFDRWGELVHQKTDFAPNTPAWDGLFGSVGAVPRACPTSVYVYYTQIRMRNGELRTLSGDVTLLR